jgi:8-oxo-dGTP diphosphatase
MDLQPSSLRYTLCFLTRGDTVLMLHRRNPPNQGLWNGVGGRVEAGETPRACVLREVREETGYILAGARFCGVLTWEGFEIPPGGLYLFTAEGPPGPPHTCIEGDLAWKPRAWVLTSPDVVSNIHVIGPHILPGGGALEGRERMNETPQRYHFSYQDGQITAVQFLPFGAPGSGVRSWSPDGQVNLVVTGNAACSGC